MSRQRPASLLCLSMLVAETLALSVLEECSFKGLSFQGLDSFQRPSPAQANTVRTCAGHIQSIMVRNDVPVHRRTGNIKSIGRGFA